MVDWPETVVEAAARRRAIVVLGAGSSFHSTPLVGSNHPPDWKRFLEMGAAKLPSKSRAEASKLIKAGEYLSACEVIKTKLAGDWQLLVQGAFGNQRLQPGDLHEYIYALDLPVVMTTNFDRVYQSAATTLSAATVKVKSYRDSDLALLARGDTQSRVVLKVHGSVDDVGSMIFTRSDYIRLRNDFPLFQRVISALCVTNTFIFVGCGLRDPDMVLLLEDFARLSKGFGEHICVVDSRQSEEMESVYKECYGLRCVRYKFDTKHSGLPVAVKELVDLTTKRRSEMAVAALW